MRRAWLLSALLLAGCGGDGVDPIGMDPGAPPRLSELQQEVFTPRCALPGCHAGPAPQLDLDLSPGQAHAHLVGVPSVEVPVLHRVDPGNPQGSYLLFKVQGAPGIVGERMPLGGPPLDPVTVERIRAWIASGARDD